MSIETTKPPETAVSAGSPCSPFADVPVASEELIGRVLFQIEKIIDHTREQGQWIPGWRMKAIRDAAREIENEFLGRPSADGCCGCGGPLNTSGGCDACIAACR